MKMGNEYILPIAGLSIGYHDFEFEIDDKFFDNFEFSEVKKGDVKVNLNVEKHERESILTFNFSGSVFIPCDRCNDEFEQPIENEVVIYLKYGHEYEEESDDVIVIPEEEEFDVSSLIYEYIILSLPIHRVHEDVSECNQEVINYLENAANQVSENDDIDPRWKCLEELKEKKDN
jgi:uncharacterized metal-binding protein YceD (DUF177 family)